MTLWKKKSHAKAESRQKANWTSISRRKESTLANAANMLKKIKTETTGM